MSSATRLLGRARLHAAAVALMLALPWWLVLAWTLRSAPVFVPALAALLVIALAAALSLQRDRRWLARRLDRLPAFEDSAALLFAAAPSSDVAQLQQTRLHARLDGVRSRDLGLRLPWRTLLLNLLLAATAATLLALPGAPAGDPDVASPAEAVLPPTMPTLRHASVRIEPPSYTGLAAETVSRLDVRAHEGSRVTWTLRVEPAPAAVTLLFLDGEPLPLASGKHGWGAAHALTHSARYRVEIDGVVQGADAPAHRIDAVPDQPPRIVVHAPTQTLTLIEQAGIIAFEAEASDDFGLSAAALRMTLAQGDGELVEVSERRIALDGEGDARTRRYRQRIDPAELGFGPGDDLILRLEVADNREPEAQTARSASYILRWPRRRASDGEGVQGLVQRAMPAYFRSQRQIIIDSEALLEARADIDDDEFLGRSDAIGVDQRILRLRYGEFLGEETEDASGGLLPEGHSFDDGHGHVDPAAAYGDAQALIDAYGHSHDDAEATTLFDPVTRERLRAALGEMWQSELHLRQGDPALALPYQHRALDLIKQIQQSSRIYLARVGLALPPIDFGRRLSGDIAAVSARVDPLLPAAFDDEAPRNAWNALAAADRDAALSILGTWLDERRDADLLDLVEALDRARRDPDCAQCIDDLRAALWPHLAVPAQPPAPRPHPDAAGKAWLQALEDPR